MNQTKVCTECNEELPISSFSIHSGNKKPMAKCKTCRNVIYKVAKKCWFAYNRRAHGTMKEDTKTQKLWTHHRMTKEMYEQMVESQNDRCAICGTDEIDCNRSQWCVDHDHSCCPTAKSCYKCRRGLLCNRCNRALGLFKDDPEVLHNAYAYLVKYKDVIGSL